MLAQKKSLYAVILFRFCIATIILVVNTTLFGLGRSPVYVIISGVYVLTIIYSVFLLARVHNVFFLYTQIFLDLGIETLLVHYTGGIESVLSLLFPLTSIAASIIISPRAAVITALLGSVLYTAVVSLEYFGIVPAQGTVTPFFFRESSYIFSLLYFRVTVFCVIGFLSAYVSEQVSKRDRQVLSLQEKLRQEDRLSAIGKLAASTAHEIRNPLASISGCVEALKENLALDEKNEKLFQLVIKETARLNDIISGLLEYVKPRKLHMEKTDMDELLDEVITLLKNSKEFKEGATIKRENGARDVKVFCDAQQIKQVFFNLLVNAFEAVEKNGKIYIKKHVDIEKQVLEIDVADNGRGISREQLVSLFEPFSSGKEGGVGLGLAIASSIIKEHGGNIDVESKEGRGALFRVFLPLKTTQK